MSDRILGIKIMLVILAQNINKSPKQMIFFMSDVYSAMNLHSFSSVTISTDVIVPSGNVGRIRLTA